MIGLSVVVLILLLAVLAARRGFALFWDDLLLTVLIAGGSALTIWTGPWIAGSLSLRGQFGVEVGLVTLFWAAVYFIWHWRGSAGWRLLRGTTAETHPPELPS